MVFQWRPDRTSKLPLHIQLSNYLREKIEEGALEAHTKIPSHRQLMGIFKISRTTVTTAINQLVDEGFLVSHPKSGIEVAETSLGDFIPQWQHYFNRSDFKLGVDDYKNWTHMGGVKEFGLSSDFDASSYFKEAILKAAENLHQINANDANRFGYEPLREVVSDHLQEAGIKVSAHNILIVPSAYSAIFIFYSALMRSGSNFLYEKANLITSTSNVHSLDMNMIPVSMDRWGISEVELSKLLPKHQHSVLHIDPVDHAPTGTVMSRKRAKAIMQLVKTHRIPVLEIGHLRDVWLHKPYPPALKSMDGGGNVVYVGSFVRSFPFDIRVTWIAADRRIIEHLSTVQIQLDARSTLLSQLVAENMFRSRHYDELMAGVREFVGNRRNMALEMSEHYLKDIAYWNPKNCLFHFWFDLKKVNTRHLFRNKRFFTFAPGYFFDRDDSNHILLCPASLPESELEPSIKMLAQSILAASL